MRNPYVIGPYVAGRKFYGRDELIDYLLHGDGHAYWVIGNRRIGKTSLLRQLERLALASGRQLPIFWDMQGCDTFASLGGYLADAVQERIGELRKLGFPEDMAHEQDVFLLLSALWRTTSQAGRELLLLCDETEALIGIARSEPVLVQQLHRVLMRGPGLRVVAVSTRAISELDEVCQDWPTSPFLSGFDMTQVLSGLDVESARALVAQAKADEPVQVGPAAVDAICRFTNYHPYLLQLLCSRVFRADGTLREVGEKELVVDPLLVGLLASDYSLLTEPERRIVEAICEHGKLDEAALAQVLSEDVAEVQRHLHVLEGLAYLRRENGQLVIGNRFFDGWLRLVQLRSERRPGMAHVSAGKLSPAAKASRKSVSVGQLNAKRQRLIELEAIRAHDLLNVSPDVLAEIQRTEDEIGRLTRMLIGR